VIMLDTHVAVSLYEGRAGGLSLPTRSYDSVPILIIYVVPSWVEPLFLPEIDRD